MAVTISRPIKGLTDVHDHNEEQTSVVFWFDGDGIAFDYPIIAGWKVLKVFDAGALVRPDDAGGSQDYTVTDNGFYETVVFAVEPSADVGIEAMRKV